MQVLHMDGHRECAEWEDDGMNESLFYMSYLPDDTTKALCIRKAVHPKKQETLAEYYVRIDGTCCGM